jgi:4-nitrophenyl phosphatase
MVSLTDRYDTFLFDCDGVIWRGVDPVPGASDVINNLLDLNKNVIFVTNNNSKTRKSFQETVKTVMGISMPFDKLYSSGITAALYVKKKLMPGEKIFLIGSKGLSENMDENDVEYIGLGCDTEACFFYDFADFVPEDGVKFVVGAFDCYMTYSKMAKAFIYIKECGAEYIATNLDLNCNISKTRVVPGTGSVLAGLSQSLGVQPMVIGKPSTMMFDMISADHNLQDKSKILMVGDNLATDIQFGINSGIDTALVLSGITSRDALNNENSIKPTYVLDSIANII